MSLTISMVSASRVINRKQIKRIHGKDFFKPRTVTVRDKSGSIIYQKASGAGSIEANRIIAKQGLSTPLTLDRQVSLSKSGSTGSKDVNIKTSAQTGTSAATVFGVLDSISGNVNPSNFIISPTVMEAARKQDSFGELVLSDRFRFQPPTQKTGVKTVIGSATLDSSTGQIVTTEPEQVSFDYRNPIEKFTDGLGIPSFTGLGNDDFTFKDGLKYVGIGLAAILGVGVLVPLLRK